MMRLCMRASCYFICAAVASFLYPSAVGAQSLDPLELIGNQIRGVVQPVDEAVLSSELSTKVVDLPFRDGQAFKKGETIIGFDCERHRSELAAAKAEYRSALLTVENNVKLKKYKAIGAFEVEISRAQAEKAKADVAALEAINKQCVIVAPFSGRVVETLIKAHEVPAANQPLVRIINDSELEVQLIVPSNWLGQLKAGTQFAFVIDETGKKHNVRVSRIGATVDPVSQTVKIIGTFTGAGKDVLAGMSGTAQFALPGG